MEVQLVVASGSKAGQIIQITGPKFLIGRADDCHLKPRSEHISRYHCAIIFEDEYIAVRDLGSKNGIFLNDVRVSMEQELKNGDKLRVGPLEFFVNLVVSMKAQKKTKVESISEAVSRTVEIESAVMASDDKDVEIADWLLASGESDQDEDTQTVQVIMADIVKVPETIEESSTESAGSSAGSSSTTAKKKDGPGSSQAAAANLLKNFFKGR
ncbi:MAG: FHA domain-containing protein [Thermoguttaceae bacterium]